MAPEALQPIFYYDLGDPGCYLVAERTMSELPVVPEWEPVLGAQLGWEPPRPDPEGLAELVAAQGLQPLRLAPGWPPDSKPAMLAATYAKAVGRVVAFSLAAFRQAFAGGRELGDPATVLIAGAACEMHPTALLKGMELRSVRQSLQAAGGRAAASGVGLLPAIEVGAELFCGEDCLERAARQLELGR